MNIFKTNDEDSIYWLKVAMRQSQSDIKSLKEEVRMLKENSKVNNDVLDHQASIDNLLLKEDEELLFIASVIRLILDDRGVSYVGRSSDL